jgi:tRNA (adenine22-N1)-methyltransferase
VPRNSPDRDRLAAIAALIPPGSRVADVGTGHGRLPLSLCACGRSVHCIATEKSPRLLADARRRSADHPGAPGVELRAGDGLAPLRPEDRVEVLVLAGMGARKIIRILDDERLGRLSIRRLVVQPQSEPQRLRNWLLRSGFGIVAEHCALDRGRRYTVIAAEPER